MRLDQFIGARIARLSRNRVQAFIGRGDVELNGVVVHRARRVRAGDEVVLWRLPPPEPLHAGWPTELCRGTDWVCLNKPGNLVVHPTARYFHHTVTAWMERQERGFDDARLVHRLDRETSGLLLIALGLAADRRYGRAFTDGRIGKEYQAIVEGHCAATMVCDGAIGACAQPGVIRVKQAVVVRGAAASTRVVLERHLDRGRSLVRCFPKHGRMHQIRVHLAALGHPILGDKIYGLAPDEAYDEFCENGLSPALLQVFETRRHMLHAAALTFEDPGRGAQRIEAPLPDDFLACLK
jgi:23S rRNA pseudouridine1911/1915/1917 synthase